MMRKAIWLILAVAFFLPFKALAYTNPGQPKGFVNDFAQMLDPAVATKLEGDLIKFEGETKHEIAVVTITDLGGDTIENYAVKLFEDWKIGKKGADNGILFLIAKDDRKMRIEVGYGLEGALPDATANKIINSITKPAFQSGDYNTGVVDSVVAIEDAIKGEDISGRLTSSSGSSTSKFVDKYFGYLVVLVLFLFQIIVSFFSKSKRWWPGGVWGGLAGLIIGFFIFGFAINVLITMIIFGLSGLGLDYFSSKHGPFKSGPGGRGGFWGGGFGGGSGGGGGFGGFGGGGSGGGGSSGGW